MSGKTIDKPFLTTVKHILTTVIIILFIDWIRSGFPSTPWGYVSAVLTLVWFIGDLFRKDGVARIFFRCLLSLPIPRPALFAAVFVFSVSSVHCLKGAVIYPIHSVEMFSYAAKNNEKSDVLHRSKYFYYDEEGVPVIVDLRREHVRPIARHLDWRATNEYTFSAAYDFGESRNNFEYLQSQVGRPLYYGLHLVNFKTGKVEFLTSLNEIFNRFPTTSFYLPDYQLTEVNEN